MLNLGSETHPSRESIPTDCVSALPLPETRCVPMRSQRTAGVIESGVEGRNGLGG